MGSINTSLSGAASALDALQYALNVSQNNIANASTPGYAKQTATLVAAAFDPAGGLPGGVLQGPVVDSRDLVSEAAVWQQAGAQGAATAQNVALTDLQNAMPTSDGSGIPAALTNFFSAASAWSASPNDSGVAQTVISAASALGQSFQTTAAAVANVSQSVTQGISATVSQINGLTGQLANLNAQVINGGQHNAGLSAQIYSNLETLSGLVNLQVLPQQDGSVQVCLSGGQPLVMENQQFKLSSDPANQGSGTPTDIAIYGTDGTDVTSQITSGTLSGQLQVRNVNIPALIGDGSQTGSLNQLAAQLANQVNGIQGFFSPTNPPVDINLFNSPNAVNAATTMAVNPAVSVSGLPAITGNAPNTVANGVPLALLNQSTTVWAGLGNASYTAYYGAAAAQVGSQLNQAQSDQSLATQSLAQAQSMRQTAEGVDLNAEAVNVLQLQQNFQAAAKLVNTLDTMTQALINMMP